MTRVAVVAESARLRSELGDIVRESGGIELVCGVASLDELEALGAQQPGAEQPGSEQIEGIDVLLIDAAAASVAASKLFDDPGAALVILSDDAELIATLRSVRTGVALLPMSATAEQIVAALVAAALGLVVFHADHAGALAAPPTDDPLTPREREVLLMLAAGLGNKAIASRLGISDHTAKFHVAQILAKLNAASRAEAVSIAMRRGLVPL
jgi:DNA-binding NarL/FixJ family response regulator